MKKLNSILLSLAICGTLSTIAHAHNYVADKNLTQYNIVTEVEEYDTPHYSIEYNKESGELYLSEIEDDSITINSIGNYDEESGLATVFLTKKATINGFSTSVYLDSISVRGDIVLNIKVTNYNYLSKVPSVFLDLHLYNNSNGNKATLYNLNNSMGSASFYVYSKDETTKLTAYLSNASGLLYPAYIEYELYGLYYMSLQDYEDYIHEN